VRAIAISPNGRWMASASGDDPIRISEVASGRELYTLKGHTGTVLTVAFSVEGQRLYSASDDNSYNVWDVTTGKEIFSNHPEGDH
ncbi:MAG: protein kinase, partial [Terriglobia bacterium]